MACAAPHFTPVFPFFIAGVKNFESRLPLSDRSVGAKMSGMENFTLRRKRAGRLLRLLKKAFPDAGCTLEYQTPLDLLVATILSAQCTDRRVNLVTPALQARCKTPDDYVALGVKSLEKHIHSAGFYHNKAKNIVALCEILTRDFSGEVPQTLDALVALPGVGRKTAHVVLQNAFGVVAGVVVDTHVGRISRRLNLTDNDDPVKIEADLCALFPKKEWTDLSHRMILLGRSSCRAQNRNCENCPLKSDCPSALSPRGC